MEYHFKVTRENSGYSALCVEFNACVTQGDTWEELCGNAHEALNLYLDEPLKSEVAFPLPDDRIKGKNIIRVSVDPEIAFGLLMRNLRKIHGYTQSEMARILGMKNIYSYQRLERRANPSLSMIARIKDVFPDISIDEIVKARTAAC